MLQIKNLSKCVLLVFVFLISANLITAQSEDVKLIQLRQQLANKYLSPTPHLALAKYYWDKGDRIQAFYISEYVRRARFPELIFNMAFEKTFGNRAAENEQAEAIFNKGVEFQKVGKLKLAEDSFVKAAEMSPNSVYIQSWTGRFFYKVKTDNQRALQYYLNAYFLDPHAYETEYVESRINKINYEMAQIRFIQLIESGTSLTKIINEPNPTVVFMALEQMTVKWQPAFLAPVLEIMSHDDEGVRWQATEAIMKNANPSFDEKLQELLSDSDLRKRGLAAYIAVRLWKQNSFEILRNMMREDAELIRFDAISALIIGGGNEGLQLIIEHRQNETHPTLKEMIDKTLSNP
jgi:tetratricopeptide (TPR) repeat protein